MRFGGHETFPVREGWLTKGLRLIEADPAMLDAQNAADRLGVGRNMAKAIRHWLVVTGLAVRPTRQQALALTPLGASICRSDPFMLEPASWWAVHLNLVVSQNTAVSWSWFFNSFGNERFDRMTCVERLARYTAAREARPPSRDTLNRDVLCLLASYAQPAPPSGEDPEEGRDSPFRELGLATHFLGSDTYQLNRTRKPVPPALLAYALALRFGGEDGLMVDIPLSAAIGDAGGPGRAFALDGEGLVDLLEQAEDALAGDLTTKLLGSERFIQLAGRAPHAWLADHYALGVAA